jgi:hypothetical protein
MGGSAGNKMESQFTIALANAYMYQSYGKSITPALRVFHMPGDVTKRMQEYGFPSQKIEELHRKARELSAYPWWYE